MLRVAFPLIGRGGWTGGINYLTNTLRLISSRLSSQIEPWLFLSPEENESFGFELRPLVEDRVIVDPAIGVSGRGMSLARAVISGRDSNLEALLAKRSIDVVFETASFYGARFSIPVVSWMPDFQHRRMPEMFGQLNWWRRDLGFRMQINAQRTIMVSSSTSRDDLEQFYPNAKGRAHIVRFAIDLNPEVHLKRGFEIRSEYDLPERYFFLPNQFWQHKNHGVIVEALGQIKAAGRLEELPPVILTGTIKDPRNPSYFDDVMQRAGDLGVRDHFRHLGLVPYDDVLSLNANCHSMINPSLFEGWSTPIEEAKALATRLILADIPIHREQAPDAHFFSCRSPERAAAALLHVAAIPDAQRPPVEALRLAQTARLNEHARALYEAVAAAGVVRPARYLSY